MYSTAIGVQHDSEASLRFPGNSRRGRTLGEVPSGAAAHGASDFYETGHVLMSPGSELQVTRTAEDRRKEGAKQIKTYNRTRKAEKQLHLSPWRGGLIYKNVW